MLKRDFDPNSLRDVLRQRAVQKRRPLGCTFELTYHCNFRCPMCYVRMTDEQAAPFGRLRTVEEWLDMARQARDAGVLYLILTGGECTQYPGFTTLYPELCRMGFRITLMSNAGAYSEEIRRVLREDPPCEAAITLYGGSNETYEKVTGDARGLDKAVENIRFYQSLGVPVTLTFTMIRQNALDHPKVARLSRELGIPYSLLTDLTPHVRNAAFSDVAGCRLSPAERAAVACHPPEETELALKNAAELEKLLSDFVPPAADPASEPQLNACVGSYSSAAVLWNGDMNTCLSLAGDRCYHPFEEGFEACWNRMQADHAARFRMAPACAACGMQDDCLNNCPARCLEGTGDLQTPDPALCRYVWLLRKYRESRHVEPQIPSPGCL